MRWPLFMDLIPAVDPSIKRDLRAYEADSPAALCARWRIVSR
jgi:hypothetical protein